LIRTGVARSIDRRSYTAELGASEIQELLSDPNIAERAANIGNEIAEEHGAREAARQISQQLTS
jgi:UDP:flavonoid glycosyltransferase YjiC (YdhE family)